MVTKAELDSVALVKAASKRGASSLFELTGLPSLSENCETAAQLFDATCQLRVGQAIEQAVWIVLQHI